MMINYRRHSFGLVSRGIVRLAGFALVGTILSQACAQEDGAARWSIRGISISIFSNDFFLFCLWFLGAIIAAKLTMLVWNWVFLPIARKTRISLDVMLVENTRASAQWVMFTVVLSMGAFVGFKHTPAIADHAAWPIYKGVVFVALVLSATLFAYCAARTFIEWYAEEIAGRTQTKMDDQFIVLFRQGAKFMFLLIALAVIFNHFGVRVTGLLATAGVASLAIAFAAKETLSNMIAGIVLLIDHPFQQGDRVELANGKMGDVIDIGLRTTRIMSFDNTVINIPNADIAANQIINLNAPNSQYKIRAKIGVAYGTDLRKVKKILEEIFAAHPDVLKNPAFGVYFTEFGDSSLNLLYICWVEDYHQQFRIRDEINMAIKDRFDAEGVEIPFPQRVVHFPKTDA